MPGIFPICVQALALPSRSKYSFEIVYLEEVVVRKVPKVVEYIPCSA